MEKFNKLHEAARKAMYSEFFNRIGEAASEYYVVDANTRKLGIALSREQDAQLMKNIAEKWEIDAESINDYVLGFNTQEELAERETDTYNNTQPGEAPSLPTKRQNHGKDKILQTTTKGRTNRRNNK